MAGHGSLHAFFRALLAFILVMSLCCSSDSAARPIHEPASQRFGLPSFSRGVRGAGFRFPRLPRGPVPPKGPLTGVVPSLLPPPPPPPTLFSSFLHGVDGSHRFPMLPKGPVPPSGPSKGEYGPPPPPPPNSLS